MIQVKLTDKEISELINYYHENIYQKIRDFDENLHYATIDDIKEFIDSLLKLIERYDEFYHLFGGKEFICLEVKDE